MNIKRLLTWFGIIGSVASILSLAYIFLPKDENLKLLVESTGQESLTQDFEPTEPDLKVQYTFKGRQLINLWKYNIKFVNNSNRTLVGRSSQKNILTDYLTFNIKKDYEILDFKKSFSEFNHKLSIDSAKIQIAFEQWRPNESLEYTFYIRTTVTPPTSIPFEQPSFRQIVDGDIVFGIQDPEAQNKKLTEHLPPQIRQAAYVISLIFTGLFIIVFSIVIIAAPFSYYKATMWYKKNYPDFILFVRETFPDSKTAQDRFIANPKSLTHWRNFKGQKYPDLSFDFDFRKFYQFVLTEVILSAINISIAIAFIDLIYMFPS